MKLAMRIRLARHHAKFSQAELALKLGVSRGAVANWESSDDAHPAAARLIELAVITQVSVDWLATGRGHMTRQAEPDDVPAVDGILVYDNAERRLIKAYRNCPTKMKFLVLQSAEAHAQAGRRTHRR